MKQSALTIATLVLGLYAGVPDAFAQSAALQKAQQAADKVDISNFLTARTDSRSQSFSFGGVQKHSFTVKKAGNYVFVSKTLPGESTAYRIQASLLDSSGRLIAEKTGRGENGGLRLEQELEPGDYTLRVNANKFGSEASGGNSYTIEVAGLDARDKRLDSDESGIDGGAGILFNNSDSQTAFVNDEDAVATIAAPAAASSSPSTARKERQENAEAAKQPKEKRSFEEIVADIRIREQGEVLTFDVAKAGTIAVTSSTFPGSGSYQLEARLLDETGRVIASDQGQGAQGDFSIKQQVKPGRYKVWVSGRKFGTAMEGANNYTLRVRQLDYSQ
ncbi:hypothetical protein [Halomonas sp. IOP_31]|uniref:hypothetical protein n=1 Tax=Halomonas sp. IOP_31 TaxID=2876584 RepID=UPI001E3E3885|nr:hypothetical protein [Halomonas sp. IOP_31]MCD6009282.1 hypothetical protein [Halomonas sp. IOP_31]